MNAKTVNAGKSVWTVAVVASSHVALVACLMLAQGCGTFGGTRSGKRGGSSTEVEAPPVAVMPPSPKAEHKADEIAPVDFAPAPVEQPRRAEQAVGPTYTIQSGDSLSEIARRYDVSAREIAEMNGITNPNKVRIGMKINLPAYARTNPLPKKSSKPKTVAPAAQAASAPAAAGGEYVVKSGDTLSHIAVRNGTTVKALREANKLSSDRLKVGQKLTLPGGKSSPEVAPVNPPAVVEPVLPVVPAPVAPVQDDLLAIPPPSPVPGAGVTAPVDGTAIPAVPENAVTPPAAPAATPVVVPAPAPASGGAENPFVYTVKTGDTLDIVARNFGVFKSQITDLNGLAADAQLSSGQSLKIPAIR